MPIKSEEPDAPAREVLVALSDMIVLAEPLLLRLWKSTRLTLGHLRVLRALRDGPRSPGELADLVGMAAPTVARTLARLEERSLIRRSIDKDDRRRIEVNLLPTGRALVDTSRVWRGSAFERAAGGLNDDDRRRLVNSLRLYGELVRAESADDPTASSPREEAAAEGEAEVPG
jgi:DNA-binding MarR family transcriptional regulator